MITPAHARAWLTLQWQHWTRPAVTLTSSRHPATVGMFAAAAFAGAWGLCVPGGKSNAIDSALPAWFVLVYYAGFGTSGLLGLVALIPRALEQRLRAERACWYGVGWCSLFYAVAAFSVVGASAGQAAILTGIYSAVATYRILQITVQCRRAEQDRRPGAAT